MRRQASKSSDRVGFGGGVEYGRLGSRPRASAGVVLGSRPRLREGRTLRGNDGGRGDDGAEARESVCICGICGFALSKSFDRSAGGKISGRD